MIRFLVILLLSGLFIACNVSNKGNVAGQEEDRNAKKMLQGIWLDDETETPLMRIKGDTIYYSDYQSSPIAFKIVRDTLYTYGNDTTFYRIDKQTEHTFWFHSLSDNIVKLHKSEDPNDSIVFAGNALEATPTYNEVTERDSVVNYKNTRYRAYVYINPSKMKVIKTTYSEEGLSMDNVYYDNVMHICVYEGKKSLYASDITKQMFAQVVSKNFLDQSILSDMQFVGVNKKGFHYQATLSIPESQVCCIANLTVDFEGKLAISVDK